MFETVEIGQKVAKKDFNAQVPALRSELVPLQYELRNAPFAVLVLLGGDDRVGTNQAVNRLNEWLDPRFLRVASYRAVTEEQTDRPLFWRYWSEMPKRGQIGVLHNAWTMYTLVEQLALDELDELRLERRCRHITGLEEALVADGTLLLKFWLHRPKAELKKQLKAAKEDPIIAWQITDTDRTLYDNYDRALPLAERVLRLTSSGHAPWNIIESTDARYRDLTVATTLRDAIRARLEQQSREPEPPAPAPPPPAPDAHTILDTVDLDVSLPKEKYERQLERWQGKLAQAARECHDRQLTAMLVFQGWDAAGKGGTIRRLTQVIDASLVRVVPIAAPSDEERAHHYLWRFWRQLPRPGHVTVFDRSWYERVLVERVEGFASEAEWSRAYREINDFEEQLTEHGVVVLKFWLHIDPDEQLRRFKEREETPFKRFKITEDDYRNRKRWNDYELAVNEMVARTDTPNAPWHIVPANDKRYARIEVLKTVTRRLEKAQR